MEDLKIIFATLKILFERDSVEGIAKGSVTAMDVPGDTEKTRSGDEASA